ncbi:MAG: phosphoenolpyruvate carboxykinase (ATP) [Bdellovibrionaceae bacterium]|nr:phosphoenolpyruvate carboxykinase (ATP) [Pseudobdellovibrionaceae bacterium]
MCKYSMIEESLKLGLGKLSKDGALMVDTGVFTGRAAKFRYVVQRPEVAETVDWGKVNQPIDYGFSQKFFAALEKNIEDNKNYSMSGYVGCFPITVKSKSPHHILFAQNMFRDAVIDEISKEIQIDKSIEVFHCPYDSVSDLGLDFSQETLIVLDLVDKKIGICGTAYAGEIKKGAFSVCNYLMPEVGIFPMHSSANSQPDGTESCVLFGLSGTGKTTLSADKTRSIIGDDEIIWSKRGLSNLEGGCYAKLIDLCEESEPEIYGATNRFGAMLENVVYDSDKRTVDFCDSTKTENTRGSYDITALENVFDQSKESSQPKTIVFLTADAFGALPAVSKLDFNQAQYHFMSGYTAKVAGTELGVTEPTATFSACFGAPFMPRHPSEYAQLLAEKAAENNATVWLLNTGWVGGYAGGKRFPIQVSRQILSMIQNGELEKQPMQDHPVFGFQVPTTCPGVDPKWLAMPTGEVVNELANKFIANFQSMASVVSPEVLENGGPRRVKMVSAQSSSPQATL